MPKPGKAGRPEKYLVWLVVGLLVVGFWYWVATAVVR